MHFASEQELEETRSRAVLHTVPEPSAELLSEGAIDLRTLIGHRETVSASDSVESVFETFRQTTVEFLAIVDGDRLAGMCSRHAIDSLLGGRYGFSLWARKPIAKHAAAHETRIAVTTPITDVLQKVFARNPESIYDDVLLVDEDGKLLRLISTETLFKVQNALLLANISQLEKKEREIREKNEQMESDLRMAMELQQAMMPRTGGIPRARRRAIYPNRALTTGMSRPALSAATFSTPSGSPTALPASLFVTLRGTVSAPPSSPLCCAHSSRAAGPMPLILACS